MYTQEELQTRIKKLDAEIASGVQTVSVDGTTTTVNLTVKREERDRLKRLLDSYRRRRPPTATMYLGGFH